MRGAGALPWLVRRADAPPPRHHLPTHPRHNKKATSPTRSTPRLWLSSGCARQQARRSCAAFWRTTWRARAARAARPSLLTGPTPRAAFGSSCHPARPTRQRQALFLPCVCLCMEGAKGLPLAPGCRRKKQPTHRPTNQPTNQPPRRPAHAPSSSRRKPRRRAALWWPPVREPPAVRCHGARGHEPRPPRRSRRHASAP